MIKAILFDLDDTLLSNDMSTFLPAYLQKLGEHMAEIVPADRLIPQLMTGTQAMLENRDPGRTLQESFSARFYPALGLDEGRMQPQFQAFYAQVFPELIQLCSRRAAAEHALEAAIEAGFEVAIATNPLFPQQAMEERLRWAGLPADRYPYAAISSYESFHFAKPHPEYFVELSGRLGLRPTQAAMVGNELGNDIQPARSLGMPTFHVDNHPETDGPGGTLRQVIPWIQDPSTLGSPAALLRPESILALLRGNLSAVLGQTQALSEGAWTWRPEPGEWALVEILCHLRDVEREVNLPRIRRILAEPAPFIPAADPDQWAEERDYIRSSGPQARADLLSARKETIKVLESIEPEAWQRAARHALLGPTDLIEILSVALEHDHLHLEQIRKTLPP